MLQGLVPVVLRVLLVVALIGGMLRILGVIGAVGWSPWFLPLLLLRGTFMLAVVARFVLGRRHLRTSYSLDEVHIYVKLVDARVIACDKRRLKPAYNDDYPGGRESAGLRIGGSRKARRINN